MLLYALVIMACIGIAALVMNDSSASIAQIRRCPKCGKRTLCKRKLENKKSPSDSNWICSRCGNDCDEFGSKL